MYAKTQRYSRHWRTEGPGMKSNERDSTRRSPPVRSPFPFWCIMPTVLQEFSLSHPVPAPAGWAGTTLTPDSRGRHFPTPGQLEHGIPSTPQGFQMEEEPATRGRASNSSWVDSAPQSQDFCCGWEREAAILLASLNRSPVAGGGRLTGIPRKSTWAGRHQKSKAEARDKDS